MTDSKMYLVSSIALLIAAILKLTLKDYTLTAIFGGFSLVLLFVSYKTKKKEDKEDNND